MKRSILISALVGALGASVAFAQAPAPKAEKQAPKARGGGSADQSAGHTAPKPQPPVEPPPAAPEGQMALGTVHIPKSVKADGKPLPAGTYMVRLTPQTAAPDARGQTPTLERWAEFVKGGKVVGREVVTIVPQSDIAKVQKDTPPKPNSPNPATTRGPASMAPRPRCSAAMRQPRRPHCAHCSPTLRPMRHGARSWRHASPRLPPVRARRRYPVDRPPRTSPPPKR